MSAAETPERRGKLKSGLLERLHNPAQLRVFLTALALLAGYLAIYQPLDERMAQTKRRLSETQKRLALARDIERLQTEFQQIEGRLPRQTDSKEWEQFMLSSIRQFPLKLESFKPDAPRELTPYRAMVMQMVLSGTFDELERFLYWLESNKRLFRVDDVSISAGSNRDGSTLMMKITVLGVMG